MFLSVKKTWTLSLSQVLESCMDFLFFVSSFCEPLTFWGVFLFLNPLFDQRCCCSHYRIHGTVVKLLGVSLTGVFEFLLLMLLICVFRVIKFCGFDLLVAASVCWVAACSAVHLFLQSHHRSQVGIKTWLWVSLEEGNWNLLCPFFFCAQHSHAVSYQGSCQLNLSLPWVPKDLHHHSRIFP